MKDELIYEEGDIRVYKKLFTQGITLYCHIEEYAYRQISFRDKGDLQVSLNILLNVIKQHFKDKNQERNKNGVRQKYIIYENIWQWVPVN